MTQYCKRANTHNMSLNHLTNSNKSETRLPLS